MTVLQYAKLICKDFLPPGHPPAIFYLIEHLTKLIKQKDGNMHAVGNIYIHSRSLRRYNISKLKIHRQRDGSYVGVHPLREFLKGDKDSTWLLIFEHSPKAEETNGNNGKTDKSWSQFDNLINW